MITQEQLDSAISYVQYIELTKSIIKNTPLQPPYDNEKMLVYTSKNLDRMKSVEENMVLDQKLYNLLTTLKDKWIWVIVTEPWCGDAAQIVPALCLFAEVSEKIDCKLLLRDSTNVIDDYKTNESRSIPKLICLEAETLKEIGTWGPRPAPLQQLVDDLKDDTGSTFGQKVRQIHQWYEENKTQAIQLEFIELLKRWQS